MNSLNTLPNLAQADEFYAQLIEMHRDFTPAQSEAANATLILLLANHIGELGVLQEALEIASADACRQA
ncbi:hypothetical protein AAKU55_003400 [Oxalobacteraceae bacterium GrIS 1.11]